MNSDNTKIILYDPLSSSSRRPPSRPSTEKKANKRVVVATKKWNRLLNDDLLTHDAQWRIINLLHQQNADPVDAPMVQLYTQEINRKIYGYKTQDLEKHLFEENQFITFSNIIDLFIETELQCFYCRNHVKVLYENVREPSQWSLERIDNELGHNVGNVTIACLSCNLKRRTMYHERYVFTKQLQITKI